MSPKLHQLDPEKLAGHRLSPAPPLPPEILLGGDPAQRNHILHRGDFVDRELVVVERRAFEALAASFEAR